MKSIPVYRVSIVREGMIEPDIMHDVSDVAGLIKHELLTSDRERLICVMLNARNRVIGIETISVGTLTASLAHPREIFKGAILKGSAGIILAHNHPSGDPSPSDEDIRLTKRIREAGKLLGIDLIDHLIIAESGAYSFKTSGVL